jgi:hypothetical protein
VIAPRTGRFARLIGPEHAHQRMAAVPEHGQHRCEDKCRRAHRAPGDVKKHVDHHNVGHHRQHQGRAQQRGLAEQQQRAAAKLDQSQNQRIGVGMAVIEPAS